MKTEWMSGQKKPLERQEHCTCERRYIDTAAWARTALSTHQMLQTGSPLPFHDSHNRDELGLLVQTSAS